MLPRGCSARPRDAASHDALSDSRVAAPPRELERDAPCAVGERLEAHAAQSARRVVHALDLAPATLSFHLKEMKIASLVTCRRDGRSLIYAADFGTMNDLIAYLSDNCCRGDRSTCEPPVSPERNAQQA